MFTRRSHKKTLTLTLNIKYVLYSYKMLMIIVQAGSISETIIFSHTLRGHEGEVLTCTWSKLNPRVLATGAADNKIILWDVR